MGPCIFNDLYLHSAPRRREIAILPNITLISGDAQSSSHLAPYCRDSYSLADYMAEYEVELPFRPHGSLFYWFTSSSETEDAESDRFNVEQDVIRVPPQSKTNLN